MTSSISFRKRQAKTSSAFSGAGDGDINEPIRETYAARVRWLIANLGTALVASSIVGIFGGAIEHMVALAALMPIVAGVGGNAERKRWRSPCARSR